MKITFVKKILVDGSPCAKCDDVTQKLTASGHMDLINKIAVADERDASSEGVELARRYQVNRAPFFIVEEDGKEPVVYTVYLKFAKEVLEQKTTEKEELKEILDDNPDLDFL